MGKEAREVMAPRSKGLSDEDESLWAQVTHDVVSSKTRNRTNLVEPVRKAQPPPPSAPARTGATQKRNPPLPELEPRATRRIARGRDEIEARVDLHGMRQEEAHRALRGFVLRCHADGLRTVLVITGKGAPREAAQDAPFELFESRDRGVLRRNVPRWLAEPELRGIVAGHTTAHKRHGGEGALYVRLRGGNRG